MKLKEARIQRTMTMRELADAADVALSTIYLIESGKTTPSLRVMRDVSKALSMTPQAIDEFAEAMREQVEGKIAA